jgi:heme-degrading monooxygenase HmoA
MEVGMLVERSEIQVKKGSEDAFAAVMNDQAVPLLAGFPGVVSVQYGRGVENSDKFILLVAWDTMDSHTAFTRNPIFPGFRALLMPFSVGGAMEHFNMEPVFLGKER